MIFASFDEELCAQCRGRCCQGHPGVWSDPERFFALFSPQELPTAGELRKILARQRLVLRDLDGILIPAPRENEQGCGFLTTGGCALPARKRPCQCLALIPDLETLMSDEIHCRMPAQCGSGAARTNWQPLQPLLKQV